MRSGKINPKHGTREDYVKCEEVAEAFYNSLRKLNDSDAWLTFTCYSKIEFDRHYDLVSEDY